MDTSVADHIISTHSNKVPIIIENANDTNIGLTKHKFIVPCDMNLRQFYCVLKKYIENKSSKESIVIFINNTLPCMTETIGSLYTNNHNQDDKFLYIIVKKESTFG